MFLSNIIVFPPVRRKSKHVCPSSFSRTKSDTYKQSEKEDRVRDNIGYKA